MRSEILFLRPKDESVLLPPAVVTRNDTLNFPWLLGNASKVRRICGGVKRRKQSYRPPWSARCCIQSWRDHQRVAVEWLGLRVSAACSGTEMVGYTEPCWVGWSKAVGNSHARFRAAHNFARVATEVGNALHLSC